MAKVKKVCLVEVKIGDKIESDYSIFRNDLDIYVCHIDDDLLYISTELNVPKDECERVFAEDCYLVS